MSTEEVDDILKKGRETLFTARSKRPRPHRDDKIITAWNGLMIAGLARAGAVLGEPGFTAMAERATQFIHDKLCREPGKGLLRSWRDGEAKIGAFAIDYTCLIHGLIELHQATLNVRWLQWAESLQAELEALFGDKEHGGYFSTHTDKPDSIMRIKEDYDGAEPSPNSLAALNLTRLAALTTNESYHTQAKAVLKLFHQTLTGTASAVPVMVMGLDFEYRAKQQIVLAGDSSSAEFKALQRAVQERFLPYALVLHADGGAGQQYHARHNEAIASMKPVNGVPAAYVCEGKTCQAPVTTVEALVKLLGV
jgi:hypothetical protein